MGKDVRLEALDCILGVRDRVCSEVARFMFVKGIVNFLLSIRTGQN